MTIIAPSVLHFFVAEVSKVFHNDKSSFLHWLPKRFLQTILQPWKAIRLISPINPNVYVLLLLLFFIFSFEWYTEEALIFESS